jgi:hypothetical protein
MDDWKHRLYAMGVEEFTLLHGKDNIEACRGMYYDS